MSILPAVDGSNPCPPSTGQPQIIDHLCPKEWCKLGSVTENVYPGSSMNEIVWWFTIACFQLCQVTSSRVRRSWKQMRGREVSCLALLLHHVCASLHAAALLMRWFWKRKNKFHKIWTQCIQIAKRLWCVMVQIGFSHGEMVYSVSYMIAVVCWVIIA